MVEEEEEEEEEKREEGARKRRRMVGGRKGSVPRRAARSEPSKKVEPVRLSVDEHQCRTARVPGCAYPEDTAGVCEMTGHLKQKP